MSDVRLSNGSPTLERTEARVSEHPKPSACRNLFGSVDHDDLKRDLKGHLREMEEAASARWNFDFANHAPLANGRLQWERLDSNDMPDFYSRQPRKDKGVCSPPPPPRNNNVDLNGNHSCVVVAPGGDRERPDAQRDCTDQCAGIRKRPACHDPSAQNKRSHTSSEEVSCPSRSHSAEHTPRKSSPKRQT